ncbi:MAG: serine hydrolase domain-containing protein [Polaromonas sp.]|uniref:serine hydrolase domain-containing protein n=1 Tax=Polaromonas sp. TaxID=1869339 RepID=UPI0040359200
MAELTLAPPGELGLCPDRLQRLLDVLRADIQRGRLPGAVALVARRGKLALFESLGQLNPAAATPMPRDAIFRIYSMTKPVVSVAVMMLMEQGKLLLSDPVAKHLPEFAGQKLAVERDGQVTLENIARPATVQDLLRHTAGLTYEFLGAAAVQRQYAELQMGSRERSNAEFSRTLAALPLMYPPGSVWEYSRATDVLGRLVEVLSGQSLGDYLRAAIFTPLGMHQTGFAVDPADHHRIAEPFAHDPDGGVPLRVLDPRRRVAMESGGGGLLSTAMDYARFLSFMRNRGELQGTRLLGPHTVDYMTADHLGTIPVTGDVLPPGYGFGLGFAVRRAAGISSMPGSAGLYYWGGIAGTTFFVDPAQDLFALLMIQAPNQRDHYRPLFRSLVYAALLD